MSLVLRNAIDIHVLTANNLSKLTGIYDMPFLICWWPYNNLVTIHCQIYDQTKFHMVKGIDNAFDHMEMCFVL